MKNIVIVGGGTAGWITALYSKKIFPDDNITLIESPEIGILGAGEGSTRQLVDILNYLDIGIEDLIKETKCTIKTGIKFTNWSKDKDYYYHDFTFEGSVFDESGFDRGRNSFDFPILKYERLLNIVEKNINSSVNDLYSDNKLLPFTFSLEEESNKSNLKFWNKYSGHSIHFDARLLASYLSNIGISRKIKLVQGQVVNIETNEQNDIIALKLNNNETILTDFVFDCSGFSRLIIGKHYNSKWQSFSEYLPMKRALPFFIDIDTENIPSYTEAIAMDYGWMWKIPLQHRYGCGSVFDSNYISDEDAIKEIENYLGFEPKYPRELKNAFNFSAGCYEEIWIKNSLAVGLSSGFVEPLEATSIMQAILVLQRFMSDKTNLNTKNNFIKQRFNELYLNETQEVVDFLYLHYITNKNNTDFWKNFSKNNKMPKDVNYILNVFKDKSLYNNFDFYSNSFINGFSYLYVLIGQKILNKGHMKKNAKFLLDDVKKQDYEYILNNQKKLIPKFLTHNDFIDIIKNDKNV